MKASGELSSHEELRLVTILFADLTDFTLLSQRIDPEDLREVVNICFDCFNNLITKHQGSIHKYGGDSIIALFGLPVAHEDDPENAVKAALEMIQIIPEIKKKINSELKITVDLGLHIGINSGMVISGEIGATSKKEYTVMGEAVNLAQRLNTAAKQGEIFVSETVFRMTRYLFDYEPLPSAVLKGFEKPIKVFKVLKIKEKPEPRRGLKGLHSILVGRDEELTLLKKIITDLNKSRGRVVFVLGDIGIGKSRLWEELKSAINNLPSPITVLEGFCVSYGENLIYWPFLQILKNIFGIDDNDSPKSILEKLLNKSKEIFLDNYKNIVPYIGYLFSIRFSDPLGLPKGMADELDEKVKYLNPEDLKLQIFRSIKELFVALSNRQPLVMAIDDLQWIDNPSLELLEFIVSGIDSQPCLILCLARLEKEKEFYKVKQRMAKRLQANLIEIILNPLSSQASNTLIHNVLKTLTIPEEFKEKILSKAEGNPFFLEEIIRILIDFQILVFEEGVWKLTDNYEALHRLEIPERIELVITSRLDRLEQDIKNVLQMASVIGKNFYKRMLQYIANLDDLMLDLHVAVLEEYGFIKESKNIPEKEYVFKHPLLQEVIYNSILKTKRRVLHLKVAECVEKIFADRIYDFCELLAEQYYRAEDYHKAFKYSEMWAKKAKEIYANREAINAYQRALESAQKADLKSEILGILIALGKIFTLLGENDKAKDFLLRALEETKNDITKFEVLFQFADLYEKMSRYEESLRYLKLAEIYIPPNTPIKKVQLLSKSAWVQYLKGEIPQALETIESAFSILNQLESEEEKDKDLIRARLLSQKGSIFVDLGDTLKAIDLYQESLALYKKHNDLLGIAIISNNLGGQLERIGKFSQSIDLLENSFKIDERIGNQLGCAIVCNNLGEIYYYLNDLEKSYSYFNKYAEINSRIQNRLGDGYARLGFGRIFLTSGDYKRALKMFNEALEIFDEVKSERMHYFALTDLMNLYIETNDFLQVEVLTKQITQYAKAKNINALLNIVYILLGKMAIKRIRSKEEGLTESAKRNLEMALELTKKGGALTDIFEIKRQLSIVAFLAKDKELFGSIYKETESMFDLMKSGIEDKNLLEKFLEKKENQEFLALKQFI